MDGVLFSKAAACPSPLSSRLLEGSPLKSLLSSFGSRRLFEPFSILNKRKILKYKNRKEDSPNFIFVICRKYFFSKSAFILSIFHPLPESIWFFHQLFLAIIFKHGAI
jgi:hypothetical protein